MKKYSVNDLKKILKSEKLLGNKNLKFSNAKDLEDADNESIIWIKSDKKYKEKIVELTKANFIVVDATFKIPKHLEKKKVFIVTSNPKLTFISIIRRLFYVQCPFETHPNAVINPKAIIDKNCYIGPNTYIGESSIGKGTIIHGNCYIYDNVKIGENVVIFPGCVIGAEGFGFARDEKGKLHHFPHLGGVIIEDDVEIQAMTNVDRGTLGDTIIGRGTKIDTHCHIGHNSKIGRYNIITAHAMIGGSVTINDFSWVAPSVSIMNQINIGSKVIVGMGAVVTKNVPKNETWVGVPARPLKEFVQIKKNLKKNIKSSS